MPVSASTGRRATSRTAMPATGRAGCSPARTGAGASTARNSTAASPAWSSATRAPVEFAQRHRLQVGRDDLVHRPALRHPDRLRGRQAGLRAASCRLPFRSAQRRPARGGGRLPGSERALLLARRAPGSTSSRPACSSTRTRFSTSASSTWPRMAACPEARCSARSRPAMPTGSAATSTAISGRAPATVPTASIPAANCIGKILVPSTVANLTFGGRNNSRLFLCASHTLYAIYVNVRGAPLL